MNTSRAHSSVVSAEPAIQRTTVFDRLKQGLDRSDPVPLYHQLAMLLRWEIGAGRAPLGEALPPIRALADGLSLNYQTVRQAYRSLAKDGVVEPRRGLGTVVRRLPGQGERGAPSIHGPGQPVVVVECNLTQATDLARQVSDAYAVPAIPWLLDGYGEPPAGVIVGTTFHELGMYERWPHRAPRLHAMRLALGPDTGDTVRGVVRATGTTTIVLVERDPGTGSGLAGDLSDVLGGESVTVAHGPVADTDALLSDDGALVVFAPRVWDELDWRVRAHPRAMTVPMFFDEDALAGLALQYGWDADA